MHTFLLKYKDIWLLIFRICVAAFMIRHGYPKLLRLLDGNMAFANPIGIGESACLVLVVFSEFFCSILIGLGIYTRWAAIPLIITMAVAGFITHSGDPFGDKEMAFMYVLIYTTLLFMGGGKYELDRLFGRQSA